MFLLMENWWKWEYWINYVYFYWGWLLELIIFFLFAYIILIIFNEKSTHAFPPVTPPPQAHPSLGFFEGKLLEMTSMIYVPNHTA